MRACGLPLSLNSGAYSVAGEGAWHTAYRVRVPSYARPLIVRLRKKIAYDQPQNYDEHSDEWHAEYMGTSLFYMQANRARPGVCPSKFLYHISPDLTCTLETDVGSALNLHTLAADTAYRYGTQLGEAMRAMHQQTIHLRGYGKLRWTGAGLCGDESLAAPARRQAALAADYAAVENLERTELVNGHNGLRAALLRVHERQTRASEPVVLVNRDITPENLTRQTDDKIGMIDPYPWLGSGTQFAAWFLFCYRFLLPAYASAPRYAHSGYDRHREILHTMADGFEDAYTLHRRSIAPTLQAEYWLWTLHEAHDCLAQLQRGLTPPERIKYGDEATVETRLHASLAHLSEIEL